MFVHHQLFNTDFELSLIFIFTTSGAAAEKKNRKKTRKMRKKVMRNQLLKSCDKNIINLIKEEKQTHAHTHK
jgi:hypothetical protein